MTFKLLYDIQPFTWHVNDVRMACEQHKWQKFALSHSKCCRNCYIKFSVLKADDEIKVRKRIFTLKTLIYVYHIMRVLRFFVNFKFRYCLVSVIVFTLLQIVEVYNEEKQIEYTVYASDSIQQERLPVSLEVGRIYF